MRATIQAIALLGAAVLTVTVSSVHAAQAKAQPVEFDRHAIYSVGSEAVITERAVRKVRHAGLKQIRRKHQRQHKQPRTSPPANYAVADNQPQLLPHPTGCPSRAFCGCGASIEVFGRSIRELWLAANWFKFPRAEPAPGMVAVRKHHVFVIREVRGPGLVLAYDANSGGRKTRIHVRSLRGFVVVNPRGSRYASAAQ